MRPILLAVLLALSCTFAHAATRDAQAAGSAGSVPGTFIVLCYHEVRSDVRDYPDAAAVDEGALVAQLAWLRGNGYTPVSLDQIVAARRGGPALPPKAVLLTFDDGYLSFYTRVYPLLREFRYPAVLAVVGAWIDAPPGSIALYGEKSTVPNASFPTWAQLREMADSGLVEIASHSYDLHRGVPANPQGNLQPAATARIFDAATGRYESDASWRTRVRADLARNADAIERGTGRKPRAIAWPYGNYNDELVRMAAELGSPVAFALSDGFNTPGVPLSAVRRVLVAHNPALPDFVALVRGPQVPEPLRAVEVDLADLEEGGAAGQDASLSALLNRINVFRPTNVYLKAYSDRPGEAVSAYFPNRHLPVRVDLFNRVAWQLRSRTDVRVFARLPSAIPGLPAESLAEVYEDLARHADFAGLVFGEATSLEAARSIASRVSAFRAPMGVSHELGRTGTMPAGIAHEPEFPGDPPKNVVMLDAAQGSQALARSMRAHQLAGRIDFGYGPDRFLLDDPAVTTIAPSMSLRAFPLPAPQEAAK